MAWYVVSYDLRREMNRDGYNRLYGALKSATEWCWPLHSVWIIQTSSTPSQVIAALLRVGAIDGDDGVLVFEISGIGDYQRSQGQEADKWLDSHITKT